MARSEFPRADPDAPALGTECTPEPMAPTEARNPRTAHIDQLPTADLVALLVEEDAAVQRAMHAALPELSRAAEALVTALGAGGRWFNLGAGTSGRIGVLDASEIPPTFGMDPERVQGLIAGGPDALQRAVEGAEDSATDGRRDLEARQFSAADALVALSASGGTPYVLGGVAYARELGAPVVGITCSRSSKLAAAASIAIVLDVGPEVIAGSTRMKGGLAQKQALHTLSTATMIRLGRTWGNRMSHLATTNHKLRERAVRTLRDRLGCTLDEARVALERSGGSLARALERDDTD